MNFDKIEGIETGIYITKLTEAKNNGFLDKTMSLSRGLNPRPARYE